MNRLVSLETHDHKSQRAHSHVPMSGNPIMFPKQIHFSISQNNFLPKLHISSLSPNPQISATGLTSNFIKDTEVRQISLILP